MFLHFPGRRHHGLTTGWMVRGTDAPLGHMYDPDVPKTGPELSKLLQRFEILDYYILVFANNVISKDMYLLFHQAETAQALMRNL